MPALSERDEANAMAATSIRWRRAAGLWAIAMGLIAVVLTVLVQARAVAFSDSLLMAAAQSPSGRWLDDVMVGLSLLGSIEVTVPLMVVIAFTAPTGEAWLGWRRWFPFAAMVVLVVVEVVLKLVVNQPHPPAGLARGYRLPGLGLETTNSYPSGHMLRVTMVFGLVALRLAARSRHARWLWSCIVLVWLVGYSRIYLGDHWPVDVAGGILLGGIGIALCVALAPGAVVAPWTVPDESG